jgi:DNA-binding SARP family transcriptional activator
LITVQLLGGACLKSGDVPLTGPPVQRHRVALLTLVAAASPQPLPRDRAMAMLWPERDEAGARRLLNLAVHVLRSALGEGAITSTGDALLFNAACVQCDLIERVRLLARRASRRPRALVHRRPARGGGATGAFG